MDTFSNLMGHLVGLGGEIAGAGVHAWLAGMAELKEEYVHIGFGVFMLEL